MRYTFRSVSWHLLAIASIATLSGCWQQSTAPEGPTSPEAALPSATALQTGIQSIGSTTSIGGFAGEIDANSGAPSVIHECYARADVTPAFTTANVWAGGFAAKLISSTAINLYAMGNTSNIVRGRNYVGGVFGEVGGNQTVFDFSYSRNAVTDWSVPSKAGAYGVLTGNPGHLASLFWDKNVDAGTVFAGAGQSGHTTVVLQTPTSTAQFPYDNGTDADWDPAQWNAGLTTHYNVLKKVARATLQSPI